jgi:hypothetical protein
VKTSDKSYKPGNSESPITPQKEKALCGVKSLWTNLKLPMKLDVLICSELQVETKACMLPQQEIEQFWSRVNPE